MTNQEAIKIIEVARAEVEWEYPMNYAAAFDKAIEALDIRVPREKFSYTSFNPGVFCSRCLKQELDKNMNFCPYCGQAIKWSN